MSNQKFDIDNLRIASPCHVGWENMSGDERKRFCQSCSLNVYNISEMTKAEAEALIAKSEGRICARIYRRADGTVITRDCPVGLRAYRKRVASFAGAALSMVVGLFTAGYGQAKPDKDVCIIPASKFKIQKKTVRAGESGISGVVTDSAGAVIPNVEILLYQADAKDSLKAYSNAEGKYSFPIVAPGVYTLEIKAAMGFKGLKINELQVEAGFINKLEIMLQVSEQSVVVGIVAEPYQAVDAGAGTTIINTDILDRKP